jgi:23S rRNA maturation-related 3'-5' exoribonuclease YhaM
MITRLDFELRQRKSIHIKLYSDTLKGLREVLDEHSLSMQEVLDECADYIANEDPRIMWVVQGIIEKKREKKMKDFKTIDANSLLDVISKSSPLRTGNDND